jgi:hypothetical protein
MSGPKRNPQAGTCGLRTALTFEDGSGAEHSPLEAPSLFLARVAISAAQSRLDAFALEVDEPLHSMVEAADLLEAAAQRLAEFSDAIKGGG